MRTMLWLILLISAYVYGQSPERIGIQVAFINLSDDYFENGYSIVINAEYLLKENLSLYTGIAVQVANHSSSVSNSMITITEESTSSWYFMRFVALYTFYKETQLSLRGGLGPSLHYFPDYKGLFDKNVLVKNEFRWGLHALGQFQYDLEESPLVFSTDLSLAYVSKSVLDVDTDRYKSIRPFKELINIAIRLGLSYKL